MVSREFSGLKFYRFVEKERVVAFLFSQLLNCIFPEVKMFCGSALIDLSVKFQTPALCL